MTTVSFPRWPTWNFSFPELDVKDVVAVKYFAPLALPEPDGQEVVGQPEALLLDEDKWRMATGRNGVCSLVLLEKHSLPVTAERPDAVIVEYEP